VQRIHLIGGSGSGKTTLGRWLGRQLGLPVIDLDELYGEPGWVEMGHEVLAQRLAPHLEQDRWVIAGNYHATTEAQVWPRATHVIVLDLPYVLLQRRTLWRTLRRGLTGEPCCNGNRESLLRLFHQDGVVRYLARTWCKRHARYATLNAEPALRHAQVLRLQSPAQVRAFMRGLAGR
jgi:adenylate kinase family enzyme